MSMTRSEAKRYRVATTVFVMLVGAAVMIYGFVIGFDILALIGGFVLAGGGMALVVVLSLASSVGLDDHRSTEGARMPSLARVRRRFFGERTPYTDSLTRTLASGGRGGVGVGNLLPGPGPFDTPPREPVVLDPDALPWELRDDESPA
jgi:hypothetical protein